MNWIIKNTGIFDTKCHTMAHRNGLGDDMGGRGDGNQDSPNRERESSNTGVSNKSW